MPRKRISNDRKLREFGIPRGGGEGRKVRLSGRKMDLEVVGWWWPPVDTVTEWMNAQLFKLSFPRSCSGEVGGNGCARTRKGQSVAPSGLVEAGGEDCRSAISIGRNAIPSEVARTREQAHEVLMSAGLNQPLPPVASPSSRHVSSPPASWENFSRPRLDPIFFPHSFPFFFPHLLRSLGLLPLEKSCGGL